MSHDENSPGDGNMSQEAMNESEVESDNFSENCEDDELTDDKFDPSDRAYFEKLKQQEREEREEIEMELKMKQQEFEVYARQSEDLLRHRATEDMLRLQAEDMRAREKEIRAAQERMHQREQEMLRNKHVSSEELRSVHSRPLTSPLLPQPLVARSSPKTDFPKTEFPKTEFKSEFKGDLPVPDFPKSEQGFKRDCRGEFKSGDNHTVLIPDGKSSSPFSSPPSPDRGFPRPSQAPSTGSLHSDSGSDSRTHHWTFEEQFKQLYELSEDPKRKEFLDDLFSFMQKRGSPVNRIPIMAKQTLDLYELFRLVVSKGGLVEVINKKLWREITKGLNLPSSITSAAFTLRTQYMKYLYPYECDKLKLSSPQELQAAIDGNRREGRRSSYGYDLSPGGPPTMIPTSHHLNGALLNGKLGNSSPDRCNLLDYMIDHGPLNLRKSCTSPRLNHVGDEDSLPPTPALHPAHHPHHPHLPPPRVMTERDALAMEAASRAMEEATRKMDAARPAPVDDGGPARKRFFSEEERLMAHAGMPSAHLKITSRRGPTMSPFSAGRLSFNIHSHDGRSEIDNSLVVSMEINGIMFQGVLFAQPRRV